jgi:integrase
LEGVGVIDVAQIDLPYIEKNTARRGRFRYYFRYQGKRLCRLPDAYGSEEFLDAYWKARQSAEATTGSLPLDQRIPGVVRPNTFHWLCVEYLRSERYTSLDKTTQLKRRQIIDSMLEEPLSPEDNRQFAMMPVPALDVGNLIVLRDRKKEAPFAADERVKVLTQIFEEAVTLGHIKANLAKLVKRFRRKTDGFHTMTPEEASQFIAFHGADSKAVLALALLMFTGVRVSDLALIGPQHRRGGIFQFTAYKGRNRHPVKQEIPVHPILDAVLAQHKAGHLAYMVTDFGKPFSIKGLSQRVSKWFSQAGLTHCTAHAVRKGLATMLAENGTTESELEGMFGWRDGKTAKIYTRNARRARLARAASSKIRWDGLGTILPHASSPDCHTPTDDVQNQDFNERESG